MREIGRLDSQKRRNLIPHLALKDNHQLSHEQARFLYEQMQKAVCDICGNPDRKVVFDHNHTTGKFRGFLCQACNSGIGQFADDPALMEKAIMYLKNEGETRCQP